MEQLWQIEKTLEQASGKQYVQHTFEVPSGIHRLKVVMRYDKPGSSQLYPSLFDAVGTYRGTRMKPSAVGEVILDFDMAQDYASAGCIPGEIVPGTWRVQLDVQWLDADTPYSITAYADDATPEAQVFTPAVNNGRDDAGIYRGELHSHTHHSDGSAPVADVVAAARKYGLDYLALTDHFNSAGWQELASLADESLMVMQGIELTGHWGHGNLHGLHTWVDTFIDDGSRTINDVIDDTHTQGGVFSVNHPFSLNLGWRYHELDWQRVDMLEIYHHLTGSNNVPQLGLWDALLREGYKITGVGAIDSHDPHRGQHRLGQVFTCVQADALRPNAIINGLKQGQCYVSLGPSLEFQASSNGHSVGVGETLDATDAVTLTARVDELAFPAKLLVMKNGFHHMNVDLAAGEPFEFELVDDRPVQGYYRLELYARTRSNAFEAAREWDRTLLLSNPIFIV
ncbi:MAG: CehA/McbA family metallohydrolase [Deinococcota bacterium]